MDLVKIDSDNGLLPDGTKPLPEPMLIIIMKWYDKKDICIW